MRRLPADDPIAKVRSAGSAASRKALFRVSLPRAPMNHCLSDHFLHMKCFRGTSDHGAIIRPHKGGRPLSHRIRFIVSIGANSVRGHSSLRPGEINKEIHPK